MALLAFSSLTFPRFIGLNGFNGLIGLSLSRFLRLSGLRGFIGLSLLAFPLRAQFDFQIGTQPGNYGTVGESTAPTRPSIDPFAQVLTDKMLSTKPTTYWETIDISSSDAPRDFTSLLRHGFGRLELTTLLLMAEEAKAKLSELVKKRVSGAKLKELASELKITYANTRAQAHQLKNKLLDEMQKKLENLKDGRDVKSSTATTPSTP